jgi:hypothetical protein
MHIESGARRENSRFDNLNLNVKEYDAGWRSKFATGHRRRRNENPRLMKTACIKIYVVTVLMCGEIRCESDACGSSLTAHGLDVAAELLTSSSV